MKVRVWRTQKNWPKELNMNIMAKTWFSSALWRFQNIFKHLNLSFFKKTFLFKLKNKFDKHIKRPQTDQQDKRCKRRNNMEKTSLDSHWFHNWSMNCCPQTAPLLVKDPTGKGDWQAPDVSDPAWLGFTSMCKVYDKILLDGSLGFCCKCSLKK